MMTEWHFLMMKQVPRVVAALAGYSLRLGGLRLTSMARFGIMERQSVGVGWFSIALEAGCKAYAEVWVHPILC